MKIGGGNMPIYRYVCKNCGQEKVELHSINDNPEIKCPKCNTKMEKSIPSKVGLKFNQEGFYITDNQKQR